MLSALLLFARGAAVLAFALIAVRLLRRSPATLRYLVLGAALTAVLVLPALETLVPTWHTGVLAVEPSAPIEAALPIPDVGGATTAPAPLAVAPADIAIPWTAILAGLWLFGLALALLRIGFGAVRARAIAYRATPHTNGHVLDAWRALDGRGAPPRVRVSSEVEGPIVVGAMFPIVVVPRTSTSWSAERWRIVLLHELAHVRQHDGVVNLIAQLACALHWIDPLAWIAARRLREERELAADDAVLRAGARASSYAEHLVALAIAMPPHAPVSVLAMAERSRFASRVIALLDADRPRRAGLHRALGVVAAITLVTIGVACVSPDPAPQPTEVGAPSPPAPPADTALQSAVERELDRVVEDHKATGAVAIVIDTKTGKPLAIASRGDLDPRAARTPGSTVKPFTFAAALEAGTIDITSKLDCENGSRAYGARTLKDPSANGVLDLGTILAVSSNVCTAKIAEPLGDLMSQSLRRYRLAAPANVDTRTFDGAAVAFGEGVLVSPLELASAYTALADGGIHHAPNGDGFRVMKEDTARAVLGLMERVVVDPRGTGHAAQLEGIRVAGKTGTTRSRPGSESHYASFVGIVPADAPRFVILVGTDGVAGSGGKVAAPVFATIATRALAR